MRTYVTGGTSLAGTGSGPSSQGTDAPSTLNSRQHDVFGLARSLELLGTIK